MSSTAGHTAGPWQISKPRGKGTAHTVWRNDEGPNDAETNTNWCCIARDIHVLANATLIAAAPELLAALIALRGRCEGEICDGGLLDRADTAIAKATGTS